jgi:Tat protein secretion system quality control protein TatD with DNase activity
MTWDQQMKFRRMGGETLSRLEGEVRCQDVGGEDPSSSLSYVRQSEEPVTGPLIPADHESDDESGVEVVVSGVVGSDDEEGDTGIAWAIVDECGADNDEQSREPTSRRVVLMEDEPLRAFDAHFHLAIYSIRRHGDIDLSIGELVEEKLQIPIETPVQLVGGVLVYCDVDSYPTTFPENTRWKVAVGIHPSNSPFFTDEEFQELTALLARPEVSALEEVGVDWTEPRSIWKEQDKMLRRVFGLAHPDTSIVLHIRERPSDTTGQESYLHVLYLVREKCTPGQKLQLHCFHSTEDTVVVWRKHFPNTYFSFIGKVPHVHGSAE